MNDKPVLRVALIGTGFITHQHAPAWVASPDAELVAICDLDRARAEARQAQLVSLGHASAKIYTDVAALLAEQAIDCVDIATRPETHRALVERFARAGVAVLCQKPLAATLTEARAMVDYCEKASVRFAVMEMWRYLPWFRDMRRYLDQDSIGPAHYLRIVGPRRPLNRARPVHPGQPYFADMPHLIVYEMFIHWIDAARYVLGDIESVYARGSRINPALAGEDWAVVILRHMAGGTSMIESSWASPADPDEPRREGDILLEGRDGSLHFDPATLELRLVRSTGIEVLERYGDLGESFQAAFTGCIGHVAAAIRTGAAFESSAADNLRTLAATLASYDSLRHGDAVWLAGEAPWE